MLFSVIVHLLLLLSFLLLSLMIQSIKTFLTFQIGMPEADNPNSLSTILDNQITAKRKEEREREDKLAFEAGSHFKPSKDLLCVQYLTLLIALKET